MSIYDKDYPRPRSKKDAIATLSIIMLVVTISPLLMFVG
jgi:hypothetical protein